MMVQKLNFHNLVYNKLTRSFIVANKDSLLSLKQLGIDTHKEAVIFMRKDCYICRSEGFEVPSRVKVSLKDRHILATLNTIESEILGSGEASLSTYAWELLQASDGDIINLSHPRPLQSLSFVRSKVYGNELKLHETEKIIKDIAKGRYSDINISTFLTACAGGRLNDQEIKHLIHSMIDVGKTLSWKSDMVVDKHCVGGVPGNRTTLLVVPIVTAFGMTMPKTSSRAITSPAGTADTMEVLAPVNLSLKEMQCVVEKENGCIVWGGSVSLSPADDILIRVQGIMDLDSEGQLIASVLSKKIAAGSTHIVIDIPVGPKAKVRSINSANKISNLFKNAAYSFGVKLEVLISDGIQPIGRGIGPSLEANDILNILQNKKGAPEDLKNHALELAGKVLEFSTEIKSGQGKQIASKILSDGTAWKKFQSICEAQGGLKEPKIAPFKYDVLATKDGCINSINNRQISKIARLAGAPQDKSAGVLLQASLGSLVERGQPLFTIYAESKGELNYAISMIENGQEAINIGECE